MSWSRRFLSALLSIAILVAPVSAALARGMPRSTATETPGHAHATVHDDDAAPAVHAVMHDCAGMMGGVAGSADCPCCAEDKVCPPDFCLAKCFQLFGLVHQPRVELTPAGLRFRPAEIDRPPDWSWRPQPPPPRV